MTAPIFILGCHRSGTSVVAGLLVKASGVSMGELMPPTEDNPLGYFEAIGVVDAHRELLRQLERDWTCPPASFRPGMVDLSALQEQAALHQKLPGVWAMKDPRSMFLLPAWSAVGVDQVRVVAVVRPTADTVRSIEKRDGIRQDRAEAIVEAHLDRLLEIAATIPLPVIKFPGDPAETVVDQVRTLARSLGLPWDESAAQAFFDEDLVRHRAPLEDHGRSYSDLVRAAKYPKKVPTINLRSLKLSSEPEWPLDTHVGIRQAQQRNELWEMATFTTHANPEVVEVIPEGARRGGASRPGVNLHQLEVTSPLAVGGAIMRGRIRPHGVIAHSMLTGRTQSEVDFFFRSVYVNSDPLAELVVDVADPHGRGLLNSVPAPVDHPRPARVAEIAEAAGWETVSTRRLSPGRSGMFFRKRILTDTELIPVVTDLISSTGRIRALESRLEAIDARLGREKVSARREEQIELAEMKAELQREKSRADRLALDLERITNRRSVRAALTVAKPAQGIFRMVRSWKKRP